MLYKVTLSLFILFIFLGGLLFPVAPTRMTTTEISRNLIQIDRFSCVRIIGAPGDCSPPALSRMDKTMIARDLRQTHAIISHRRIAVPPSVIPNNPGTSE
ncbi:hypothetical protein H5410_063650 [Solanum commersonii]|uniref:Uncharacterized protein n=1 Tax=Solanum commersonii TaxID=4109 RepID=A0A9J5WF55_SOLCO|nr:hypothetical protein H5410_063650 [Solanum commersonii]